MSCNLCNWRETAIAVANEFSAAKAEFEQQLGEVEAKADRLAKLLGEARGYVEFVCDTATQWPESHPGLAEVFYADSEQEPSGPWRSGARDLADRIDAALSALGGKGVGDGV